LLAIRILQTHPESLFGVYPSGTVLAFLVITNRSD